MLLVTDCLSRDRWRILPAIASSEAGSLSSPFISHADINTESFFAVVPQELILYSSPNINGHWLSSWNNIASSDIMAAELLAQNKPVRRTSSVFYYSCRRQQFPFLKSSATKVFSAYKCHCPIFSLHSSPGQNSCQLQGYFCLSIN